jgi:glutamate/tyrosine decarboxylase-like PLP-dependent enzyme
VREPRAYSVSRISAPYLVEDTDVDHPGWSTTLEGSRSATGAGAVWLSSRVLPLNAKGHGAVLNQTLATTRELARRLEQGFDNIYFTPGGDTNIVCFTLASKGSGLRDTNRSTARIIEQFSHSPNFAISRTALGTDSYGELVNDMVGQWGGSVDDDHLLVIRMVVMSPYLGDTAITGALLDEFVAELKRFSALA